MASATDRAYEAIRSGIVGGRYESGTRLREEELADDIGVSRTPIREALRRLDAEGMVEFVANRGAHVASWSDQDLREIFDLRAVLEGFAARLAARDIDEATLGDLDALATEMEQLAAADVPDVDAISELNTAFHGRIVEAAGNRHLAGLLSGLVQVPLVHRTFRRYDRDGLQRSMNHHRELLAALEKGDVNWAGTVMRSHVYAARTVLEGAPEPTLEPDV